MGHVHPTLAPANKRRDVFHWPANAAYPCPGPGGMCMLTCVRPEVAFPRPGMARRAPIDPERDMALVLELGNGARYQWTRLFAPQACDLGLWINGRVFLMLAMFPSGLGFDRHVLDIAKINHLAPCPSDHICVDTDSYVSEVCPREQAIASVENDNMNIGSFFTRCFHHVMQQVVYDAATDTARVLLYETVAQGAIGWKITISNVSSNVQGETSVVFDCVSVVSGGHGGGEVGPVNLVMLPGGNIASVSLLPLRAPSARDVPFLVSRAPIQAEDADAMNAEIFGGLVSAVFGPRVCTPRSMASVVHANNEMTFFVLLDHVSGIHGEETQNKVTLIALRFDARGKWKPAQSALRPIETENPGKRVMLLAVSPRLAVLIVDNVMFRLLHTHREGDFTAEINAQPMTIFAMHKLPPAVPVEMNGSGEFTIAVYSKPQHGKAATWNIPVELTPMVYTAVYARGHDVVHKVFNEGFVSVTREQALASVGIVVG